MNNTGITIVTVSIVSFLSGVYISQWFKCSPAASKGRVRYTSPKFASSEEETEDETEDEEDIDINSLALNEVPGEVRMTLIVRQDLKMGKGKAAAQCSHATLSLYKKITNPNSQAYNPEMVSRWEYGNGQAKITLQVPNQEEMDMLFAKAMSLGINSSIIHDAGRTQIAAGSATVLGLGPAPKRVLDEVTGALKLY
ncbi:hypothetical protein KGF56_002333 [Candida oxycetoniae]|uniref:peptidyl-tRNA hydrolase n=1 Tax=Candida oxycetoniae TaxID=497107 RepID=A0AAI9SXB0_9ASCO|nr:uncharacterized protein KGF56_002333 [Candida oxycetoniae]KAI3404816.2 hypothetical protein KGF56_002333 [Candida oxycetoniae]